MRIAMLSWESLHSIAVGGVAAHVSELAEALAINGHEVHVFTRATDRPSPKSPPPGYQLIGGVHYHLCEYEQCDDFLDDINNMCRRLARAFLETEDYIGQAFDIVHAHDWLTANAMIWIKQVRGRRCVLTIHSTEYARCGNCFPDGRPAQVREQERAGTYWADRVIAVSGITRDEVQWMYNVPTWKTAVIHNGVHPQRFQLNEDPGAIKARYQIGPLDPTVLFCGRLAHQKGPDLLLETVPAVRSFSPNARFVFVGDGDMRRSIEHRAAELSVTDAVRILGYRNGRELPQLYHMADLVCVPSRNEPFGIVVLEAWSAATPVVVTHVGGPAEYVDHDVNGLKVAPDPDDIAHGIRTVFENFDHARRMGRRGLEDVQTHFNWSTIAEHTLSIYDPDYAAQLREAVLETPPPELTGPFQTHGPGEAKDARFRQHDHQIPETPITPTRTPVNADAPLISVNGSDYSHSTADAHRISTTAPRTAASPKNSGNGAKGRHLRQR